MELKFHKIIKAARDHFSMIFLLSVTDSISLDVIAPQRYMLRSYVITNVNKTKNFFVDIEEAWLSTLDIPDRQGRVPRPFVIPGAYEPPEVRKERLRTAFESERSRHFLYLFSSGA